ncbi:MAG: dTDP-4-dehydrorhamnose reductase [Candidatus Levybacteria bacterium]|nr:dTDP-4-dehydrorhamnose reductase [Candidatus Levybacteria bacterium]
MKILIFGKTGQLGEQLYIQGIGRKHKVLGFSHKELDITDRKTIEKMIKKFAPDVVMNATAYHVVPDCELYPDKAFLINAIAIRDLAEICQNLSIRFVHYSTDYVFDGKKGSPYLEYDLPTPVQTYGISKMAGEYMALAFNPKSIVIRASGVYGGKHGSRSKKGNFALNILREKNKKTLEVSSEQIVNPTYSFDLANATHELIRNKDAKGIYHLANDGYCSWAEFAQEIMRLVGSKTKVIPVDRSGQSGGAKRPLFSALKNIRAAKLGVKLPTWQDAIRRYIITLS